MNNSYNTGRQFTKEVKHKEIPSRIKLSRLKLDTIFCLFNERKNINCSKDWYLPTLQIEVYIITQENYFTIYIKSYKTFILLEPNVSSRSHPTEIIRKKKLKCIKRLMSLNYLKYQRIQRNIKFLILPIFFYIC